MQNINNNSLYCSDENQDTHLSRFNDGYKYKFLQDGTIAFKTDKSSQKNVLLNNLKLDDYFYSQNIKPTPLINPVFKNTKIHKTVHNKQIKYRFRLNRKKNKKRLQKIIYNGLYEHQKDYEYITWCNTKCDMCSKYAKLNHYYFCKECEENEIFHICPSCHVYNGTGDICLFCSQDFF